VFAAGVVFSNAAHVMRARLTKREDFMGIKELSWSGALAVIFSVTAFADVISGSAGAGFQNWAVTNLNENGSPFWDNPSMDGPKKNVGFYLTGAPTAPLPGAPGALPYWGEAFNSNTDTGGAADLSFFFQRDSSSSISAILELQVAARSNVNEFGWYNTSDPSTLHALFAGGSVAPTTNNFSPSTDYGFYLKSGNAGTYFTQSSLNSGGDTAHQHFAVFRDSSVAGTETYWIGVEDLPANGFAGNENNTGDYNDMLIRISVSDLTTVPEPSTAMLVLSGSLLIVGFTRRRSTRGRNQRLRRRREAPLTNAASS
jgi:hypothetical protein